MLLDINNTNRFKFERERKELFIFERINRNHVFVECSFEFVFDKEFFWKCNRGKGEIYFWSWNIIVLIKFVGSLNQSSCNFLKIYRGYRIVKSYWIRK